MKNFAQRFCRITAMTVTLVVAISAFQTHETGPASANGASKTRVAIPSAFLEFNIVPAQTSEQSAGDVENGKTLYSKIGCYECHGWDAAGASTGPRIAPPLPWTAFSQQVRSPADSMPPYTRKVLSDSDLSDIYAFLGSLPKGPAQ